MARARGRVSVEVLSVCPLAVAVWLQSAELEIPHLPRADEVLLAGPGAKPSGKLRAGRRAGEKVTGLPAGVLHSRTTSAMRPDGLNCPLSVDVPDG